MPPPLLRAALSALCALSAACAAAPVDEFYDALHDFDPSGNPAQPLAADPLAAYSWASASNVTSMQRYAALPLVASSSPPACVVGAASLLAGGGGGGGANASFVGFGRLRLDFGVERAGWLEFTSPDLAGVSRRAGPGGAVVKASVSEYDEPWTGKTIGVTGPYDGGVYRLEGNAPGTPEIYEGVRFGWIIYEAVDGGDGGSGGPPPAWTITSARVVAQVKPVNYTSSFASSDATLTAIWFAGAYGSRLNMHEQEFGSILMDRGDRTSIQGDGHPTMAAALAAFASPEVHRLVHQMLRATDSANHDVVDSGIMSYPVLWTLSVHDWLFSSGDGATFLTDFADDVAKILDEDVKSFLTNPGLSLMGWDDRLGNGWCWDPTPCEREPQLTFAALLVMAVRKFAAALTAAGAAPRAANYSATADRMAAQFRAAVPLDSVLGVHSASMMLNDDAIVVSPDEQAALVAAYLNDATSICSWSPFNSFWILQGLGNAGLLDRASEMASLCWGGMTRLAPGCFWELFEPSWEQLLQPGGKAPTRPSYCHPWSDGVTAWMSRALGGISPRSPGFRGGFVAAPHVSALYPNISASATTPDGATISVFAARAARATRDGATTVTRTVRVLAARTHGVVGLPVRDRDEDAASCELARLFVDGVEAPRTRLSAEELGGALHFRNALPRTHVFSPALAAGAAHTVRGEYACAAEASAGAGGAPPLSVFPPVSWQATAWGVDTTTQGAWLGVRGADGYALFAFDEGASATPVDVQALPPYVVSADVVVGIWENIDAKYLGRNDSDAWRLQDPRNSTNGTSVVRRLGYKSSGGDGSQGIVVDVNMTQSAQPVWRTLSFYVCSAQQPTSTVDAYQNSASTSMILRIMDLNTRNPIAPDVRFDAFDTGAWFSVTICCGCNGNATFSFCGVRARFMQIDGTNTISAVVFDTSAPPAPPQPSASGALGPEAVAAIAAGGAVAALLVGVAAFLLRGRLCAAGRKEDEEDDDARFASLN